MGIIALTLRFFREKAARDPEFRTFTWEELHRFFESTLDDPSEVSNFSQLAVSHVLAVSGLSSAWYGIHWGVARDVEELLELEKVDDLVHHRNRRRVADSSSSPRRASRAVMEARAYDVFVSHASEDKAIARPLVDALEAHDVRVWFDEVELRLGDSLRRSIDARLARCRYGVVILSPHFLQKEWPQRELDALVARETATGAKAILPIWHNVDAARVARHSPTLADRVAARTTDGIESLVAAVLRALSRQAEP